MGYATSATYLLWRPRNRQNRSSRIAAFLLVGLSVWLFAYAGQLSVTTVDAKLFFQRVKYVGPATVPLLWFAYVLTYTGYVDAVSRRAWAALTLPPAVMFSLAASYPSNRLMWTDVFLRDAGDWVGFGVDHAVAFYVYQVYVYALFLASVSLLGRKLWASSGVYRRQTLGLLVGAVMPGVLGVLHITNASPLPNLDLPAIALVGTAAAVACSATRDDLFTLEPVAWETAIAQLDDAVFVLDSDDRVVAVNDAAKPLVGDPVGESAAATLGDVLVEAAWTELGDHECEGAGNAHRRVYEVSVSPVERDRAHLGRVVVLRDVTERRERERRLDEFASVVSHDLRNPMNVAEGHLELAREPGDTDHVREAAAALDRMDAIIEDILALARQTDVDLQTESLSLAAVAETAWDAVDDATLCVVDDRPLDADRTALLRVLENLFRNAVEHGSTSPDSQTRQDAVEHGSTDKGAAHGTDVTVTVGATDDGFYVADDGPGIPGGDRDSVFDYGYTTSSDGTGLGLAIVQAVANRHGWNVSLSESEGGGARLDFDIE